jgi:hypothetical protein
MKTPAAAAAAAAAAAELTSALPHYSQAQELQTPGSASRTL